MSRRSVPRGFHSRRNRRRGEFTYSLFTQLFRSEFDCKIKKQSNNARVSYRIQSIDHPPYIANGSPFTDEPPLLSN